ncbi:hypothetical protein [Pseudomonas sp. MWU13-2100]|uniref:hypothetical protein n=1 Tax=Pseudomonas sp. MWU13-2100 TaxID=2935075 RepID=UPI00200E31A9|nr:hypothetical protein [Pseudomonas sp. MWU13-2100]
MITDTGNGTKKLGVLLAMRPSLSNLVKSQKIALGLALFGIAALFAAKRLIEWALQEPVAESWVDLTLVLTAYLYFFMIPVLQAHICKKLRRRAARLQRRVPEQVNPPGYAVTASHRREKPLDESLTQPVGSKPRPVLHGKSLGG